MTCIAGAFEPEIGVALLKRIDEAAEKHRREARGRREEEVWEAHAADGLASLLLDGANTTSRSKSDVVFV